MEFQTIGVEELWKMRMRSDVLIIDLRDKRDYQRFHIERAQNYPYDEIANWADSIPKNKKLLLYCEHGSLSMLAAKRLSRMGFDVYTLVGGIRALNS